MRLVAHVTKKYAVSEDEMEELISIGTIGLIKAVSSFKADYGNRFATFAIRCIENEILMHFRSRKKSRGDVSIFEPIGTDKEGNQIHLVDVIENGQSDVVSDIEVCESLKILRQNMRSVLSDREYYIITKRFGLDGEKELTQRQKKNKKKKKQKKKITKTARIGVYKRQKYVIIEPCLLCICLCIYPNWNRSIYVQYSQNGCFGWNQCDSGTGGG